jgi:hypothetical protein
LQTFSYDIEKEVQAKQTDTKKILRSKLPFSPYSIPKLQRSNSNFYSHTSNIPKAETVLANPAKTD